eukprot:TRINITY_DN2677_c0_g1_i8.p1 TRINITY_DN2677_c0_g1~~TRINITY_DN2677_c0_g1_i8.p1  ORF type:complete len:305 (+),score=61.65 TRINITY_DN2677_c0_g1_i8:62-976(+)
MLLQLLALLPYALCIPRAAVKAPNGPQGPAGAVLKYDLLQNNYPGATYGAFLATYADPCLNSNMSCNHNNEMQTYLPDSASQAANGEITIKAERHSDGWITSARLESYQLWTTAQDPSIKNRGYLEVRSTLPAKVNGGDFTGSWPAIWMLGNGNGAGWPAHGEIDIVEMVNGNPKCVMSTHSSSHHGGNPQHPPANPIQMNADLVNNELISGFEWNVHDSQIDMTWWMTWFDLGSQSWTSQHSTLVVQSGHGQDYHEFYDSFMGEGFSLIINLAEGGDMPGTNNVFQNGQPQYIVVKSAKAYGF